jgi:trehalose 6-phosphate synthase
VFGILRWRNELLDGLLGADLICFQTPHDVRNFLDCVHDFRGLPIDGDPSRVRIGERTVEVDALPIGIDYDAFRRQAAEPSVRARAERLRRSLGVEKIFLGVDRLDYTKGIVERLHGFERFLDRRPEWRQRVCFVQVTVPSRDRIPEYGEMKQAIEEVVGRIAGRFTHAGRSPLRYMYTALSREHLAAYYQAADVGVVTPLRDGMNLVAKEFVACRRSDEAVLLLSEFAGAAQELDEAVLANPYDPEAIRRCLESCVTMSPEERRRRMRVLDRQISTQDLGWWTSTFLGRLDARPAREWGDAARPA